MASITQVRISVLLDTPLWQLELIRDPQKFIGDPDALAAGRIRALLFNCGSDSPSSTAARMMTFVPSSGRPLRLIMSSAGLSRGSFKTLLMGKLSIDELPKVGPRRTFGQITAKRPILGPLREGIERWILPVIHSLIAISAEGLEIDLFGPSRLTAEYVNAFATALLGPGTARPSASHSACPHR